MGTASSTMARSGRMSFWIFVCLLPCTFTLAPLSRSLISVPFCCEDDAFLKMELIPSQFGFSRTTAKCSKEEQSNSTDSSLEWERTKVKDMTSEDLMEMSIRKSEVKDINCYNIKTQDLDIHISGSDQDDSRNRSGQGYDIRLVGGYSEREGNVLVNGQPICDDSWDMDDANVACRMLGFEGAEDTVCCSEFGSHGSTFIMDNLDCNGYEDSLFDCAYDRHDDCGSSETAGVRCRGSPGPTGNFLKADGGVVNHLGETWEADSFCLSKTSSTRMQAVQCLPAKTVLPSLLDFLWEGFNYAGGDNMTFETVRDFYGRYGAESYMLNRIIVLMDENDDSNVDREEFHEFIYAKLNEFLSILDTNENGVIDVVDGSEGKFFSNLPFKFFDEVVKTLMLLADATMDDKFSLDDLQAHYGENGQYKLSDYIGGPMIALPGPLYKLYTLIDVDEKEDVSLEEAKNFLMATFAVLDGNKDCKLSLDEFVEAMDLAGLPDTFGPAIRGLVQTYITLGDFILTEFFKKVGEDGKTALASIQAFSDMEWLENSLIPLAVNMGFPNEGPLLILAGLGLGRWEYRNDYRERERKQRAFEGVLLTALH